MVVYHDIRAFTILGQMVVYRDIRACDPKFESCAFRKGGNYELSLFNWQGN